MDTIVSHLKLAECKQTSLCKAHEQLHSEASSFLLFSLQWKDLETHFVSTRDMIQMQCVELEQREKAVALKEERLVGLEKSIGECSKELNSKKEELKKLNRTIEKCDGEARLKEKDLDIAQARLGVLSKDIRVKEDEFEEKQKAFNTIRKMIDEYEQVMQLKEQKLNETIRLMNERSIECDSKGELLESIRALIQENEEELVSKEKQHYAIQAAIKATNGELKLKEKELETIQKSVATMWKEKRLDKLELSIKLRTEELGLKDKEFVLMQDQLKHLSEDLSLKESELEAMKTCIKEHSKELDVQEKQLNSTRQSIRDCEDVVRSFTKYISSIEKAIIECSKEWELEENHPESMQESVDDYSNELPSVVKQQLNPFALIVDKCLDSLNAQKERFNSLRRSIEERSKNEENDLERQKEEINSLRRSIEERSKNLKNEENDLEREKEEINSLRRSIEDQSKNLKNEANDLERRKEEINKMDEEVCSSLKNLESAKVDMDSKMILLEKGREELRLKEEQHKEQAEKLESKEKDIISLAKPLKEKSIENVELMDDSNSFDLKVKTEETRCRPADNSLTLNSPTGSTVDGKVLLVLACEHLKLHDLVRSELFIYLQASPDPAKLVLDAMKLFYASQLVIEDSKINLYNVKRGCILLSDLFLRLLRLSPIISPPVREEALELASEWKAKMKTLALDNHVEVLAFLLLVANFRLTSDFEVEELSIFLNSVSQYKQGLELARTLGIGDESSEASASPTLFKLEQPGSLTANKVPVSSLKTEQQEKDPNEIRLYSLLNKQLTGEKLMEIGMLSNLKESSDPPKLALDIIQDSYRQQLKKKPIVFEDSFLRGSILLLKQLKLISPSIGPKLKEDALKLAVVWKANISGDGKDSLHAVGFLQFVDSYGLTTSFSDYEILKIFEIIVLHEQALELCLIFGYNHKIQELVQNLIGTKQFVKAVRFIHGYKLESFRSEQILSECLLDARTATSKANTKTNSDQIQGERLREAIDKEIDAVKSVITCVVECNLGSKISSQGLQNRIVLLEDMKRSKCNGSLTPVNMQQVRKPNLEAQRPLHSTKGEMLPPHSVNFESQQLHPTHQPHQQHPPANQPHPPTGQPHSFDKDASQQVERKRKNSQLQNDSVKRPRRNSPTGPVLSSSSGGSNDESKGQHYRSKFLGSFRLFGLEEGGHESTEHEDLHARPTRPKA